MLKIIVGLLVCCLLYSCQKEAISAKDNNVVISDPGVVFNVNKNAMLDLVNRVRRSGCTCGTTNMPAVGALTWNDRLSQAAYEHSKDMQTQNYFSHTSKNGADPGTRISNAGYTWRAYGENIAKGYINEESVMDGWLKSEGHCKNIMNPNFKELGAGREGDYWAQEFGAR